MSGPDLHVFALKFLALFHFFGDKTFSFYIFYKKRSIMHFLSGRYSVFKEIGFFLKKIFDPEKVK